MPIAVPGRTPGRRIAYVAPGRTPGRRRVANPVQSIRRTGNRTADLQRTNRAPLAGAG